VATLTWSVRPGSATGGSSSSASIASSAASVSFRPSASKSLTPLYSGGLCEAEMTTPRSSASSATAGVGTMPAMTALPPAETTPRAKASSSSRPDPRVARQVAGALERDAQLRVGVDERTGDPVADGAGLAARAAALYAHAKVERPFDAGDLQRRQRQLSVGRPREVLLDRAAVEPG